MFHPAHMSAQYPHNNYVVPSAAVLSQPWCSGAVPTMRAAVNRSLLAGVFWWAWTTDPREGAFGAQTAACLRLYGAQVRDGQGGRWTPVSRRTAKKRRLSCWHTAADTRRHNAAKRAGGANTEAAVMDRCTELFHYSRFGERVAVAQFGDSVLQKLVARAPAQSTPCTH